MSPISSRHSSHNSSHNNVPVIIIGNITVGGTGKTPLIMALVKQLEARGVKAGVISRGYGGTAAEYPLEVTTGTPVQQAGDEALLVARQCECPVVVGPDRCAALDYLIEHHDVDVVFSDDGLQHYRLHRDLEIAVVDGARLFGNELCLPAGPLREPVSRLRSVDAVVVNGKPAAEHPALLEAHEMSLKPTFFSNLAGDERLPFSGAPFKLGATVQAVAAIGNPTRFFRMLEQLPYSVSEYPFPDHHALCRRDLEQAGVDFNEPIVMTEKDGIKCDSFAEHNWWVVELDVKVPEALLEQICACVGR